MANEEQGIMDVLRLGILSNPNRSLERILYFFMTACRLLPVKFPICETCLTY